MPLHDILHPICTSLSQCPWEEPALARHLETRLPRALTRMAAPLARWLIAEFPKSVAPDGKCILRAILETGQGSRILAHARKTATAPTPALASPAFRPAPAL
ncbi:MAG: hypothetical protein ACRC6I_04955, partial [Paracoccaceae bacterium]